MEQTMKTLVEAAQEGDQQAIAQLYEKTSKKAYYLAKQLLKDEDTAQDILQDSYVKVFANLHMLRQPENFQGWLDTVVVNKSKDYLRKKKPMLFSQLSSDEEPDQELELGEVGDVIAQAVERLPIEQREVFLLRQQELAFKEIAEIQGCSINTVLGRMQYAMKSLRRLILEIDRGGIVT